MTAAPEPRPCGAAGCSRLVPGRARYCSDACRSYARNARRRAAYAHARRWGDLARLHALEAAGQTSLDPTPLPAVPPLEVP